MNIEGVVNDLVTFISNQWEEDDEVVLESVEFVFDTLSKHGFIEQDLKEKITKILEEQEKKDFIGED